MTTWMFEAGQLMLAAIVLGYIFYTLLFSAREAQRLGADDIRRQGFERRAAERLERRLKPNGAPAEDGERRTTAPRRG